MTAVRPKSWHVEQAEHVATGRIEHEFSSDIVGPGELDWYKKSLLLNGWRLIGRGIVRAKAMTQDDPQPIRDPHPVGPCRCKRGVIVKGCPRHAPHEPRVR